MAPTTRASVRPRRSNRLSKSLKREYFGTSNERLKLRERLSRKITEVALLKQQLMDKDAELTRINSLRMDLQRKLEIIQEKARSGTILARQLIGVLTN